MSGYLGNYCVQLFPPGILRDLLVEGIISGVGAILIFLPQIIILILFMTILEDTGYMARVAFMMDKLMNKIGLHGKSVLPLMSGYLGNYCVQLFPPGILRDLLVEGIISGVGAILIFLPQIIILILFMTILEDTGYMARVAFMMDKLMNKIGLHGKSVLPLMSGYACAIPGIMATRTIDSWKERMITIIVLPLISCSARLPVYTLMIGAFIPNKPILGFLNLQGLTMVLMYFLGNNHCGHCA
jgi:Fe2+ transport system protein B